MHSLSELQPMFEEPVPPEGPRLEVAQSPAVLDLNRHLRQPAHALRPSESGNGRTRVRGDFDHFPIRDSDGILRLRPGHFGISEPAFLHALMDLVKGFSNQVSAQRVSSYTGVPVSRCTIRDSFRCRLYENVRAFRGNVRHVSLARFCEIQGIEDPFAGPDNNRVAFCVARYLLEVFDLYEPVHIESVRIAEGLLDEK